MRLRLVVSVLVLLVCGLGAGLAQAAPVGCTRSVPSRLAYGWPLKPFDQPHPVRGNFGDPRTLYWGLLSDVDQGGSFTFHNGIDVSAPAGTPVFPVVDGVVVHVAYDWVSVRSPGRHFQYWHIRPRVALGQRVLARKTVLGRIVLGAEHVHLTEIDGTAPVNPLEPGHLTPYRKTTWPVVRSIDVRGTGLHGLQGWVWFVADVSDYPALDPPPPWGDLPVTPALVSWKLRAADGKVVVPLRVAADFRTHLPRERAFWRVYASRTRQNQPVIALTHWHTPGRYLFDLTPGGFDTRRLHDGRFRLTVIVSDVCGNTTARTESIVIANEGGPASGFRALVSAWKPLRRLGVSGG